MFIDQGGFSVFLHGHHGALVQVAIVGGDNGFVPTIGTLAYGSLDLRVTILLKGFLHHIVVGNFVAVYC